MRFEERLQKAIQRGEQRGEQRENKAREKSMNEGDLKTLHSKYRLALSEKIEDCLRQVPNHFPGFQFKTIYGERGWGAAVSRDDIDIGQSGQRNNRYSRLEMTIRPFSIAYVLDLASKATVRNRELFNRNHFEKLEKVDTESFEELIDLWILEYAEQYASKV